MSSQQHEREQSRVDLEPVTCWPLILGAGAFVGLGVCALAGFALWGALQPRAGLRPVALATPAPVDQSQPERTRAEEGPIVAFRPDRQVIQKRTVEINYHPTPRREQIADKTDPSWAENRGRRFPAVAEAAKSKPVKEAAAVAKAKQRRAAPTILVEKASLRAEALRATLWSSSREVDLEAVKGDGKKLYDDGRAAMVAREKAKGKDRPALTKSIRDLVARRDDLRGLPLVTEEACQSDPKAVKALKDVSQSVRDLARRLSRSGGEMPSYYPDPVSAWIGTHRGAHARDSNYVGPLVQLCQIESEAANLELVGTLSATKGKEATQALAGRAVFDLSPEVRGSARADLKGRPLDDVRPVLLSALRHPWAPAADHAALALVELDDQKARVELEKLAKEPDACEPVKDGDRWYVRELVRVNHLRNCLLCHAPAERSEELLTGLVPTPGRPLPVVYYSGRTSGVLVRADVVYLRQDFSVMHKVEKATPWPEVQRFDYLIRTREVTAKEAAELAAKPKSPSPRREAALSALAELKLRQEEQVAK